VDRPQIHAAVLHGTGEVPRYQAFPAPVAGPRQEVLTVLAAALKPFDVAWTAGLHPASPATFPRVVGADGVGCRADGRRVAFFGVEAPYGGMAEQALVRAGLWLPVPDSTDDAMAAAVLNPGGAAWKTVFTEGELTAGQRVLVLGATGLSGRIAAQLALRHGARVVVAGRNQRVLDQLLGLGVEAAVRLDRTHVEVAATLAAAGPYDLIVDYLWGPPAEAAFSAVRQTARVPGAPERVRYVLVGMSAGATAALPAMTMRSAPIELIGSGIRGPAPLAEAAAAYEQVLGLVADGSISVDVETVPLADVAEAWTRASGDRRIVFVP